MCAIVWFEWLGERNDIQSVSICNNKSQEFTSGNSGKIGCRGYSVYESDSVCLILACTGLVTGPFCHIYLK